MLSSLYVRNYAIIEEITIEFDPGYNVITGETGAGKSILLGALSLIMGKRSDKQVLYDESNKCIVEATFNLEENGLLHLPISDAYEAETRMILRREINRNGKSRAFVNDGLVSAGELKMLATSLLEIHNQFDSLSIMYPEYQLSVVDALCDNGDILDNYREVFEAYTKLKNEVDRLKRDRHKSQVDLDYYLFQLKDLEKIPLEDLDQFKMEDEFRTLSNGEEIKKILHQISHVTVDDENSIENQLIVINREIHSVADLSSAMHRLGQSMDEIIDMIRNIAGDARDQFDNLNYSQERLQEIKEDLDHIYTLQNKHRVQDLEALIAIRDDLKLKTGGSEALEVLINQKEAELAEITLKLQEVATSLSNRRASGIPLICRNIEAMLSKLAMPNARVRFDHRPLPDFNETGIDQITLYFSANKGIAPKSVSDIASGGEISRLAICVKSLIAQHIKIDTLLFDEIDTGISGVVAIKVADILNDLANRHQVICITHSPQVAAKANRHLFVYKSELQERTATSVKTLKYDERIEELAKMLSTDPPTDSARSNAQELLELTSN